MKVSELSLMVEMSQCVARTPPFVTNKSILPPLLVGCGYLRGPLPFLLEIDFGQVLDSKVLVIRESLVLLLKDLDFVLVAIEIFEEVLWLGIHFRSITMNKFQLNVHHIEFLSKEIIRQSQAIFTFLL